MASEAAGIVHGAIKHANIAIYTKQIVTDSFWVHIHFFLHDNRILDPILSEITRGGIKICLIACDESADTNEFRKYLGNTGRFNPSVDQKSWKNKTVRPEQVFEGKILSKMNDMSM